MKLDDVPIIDLSPSATGKPTLTPETPVLVINRGHETLTRKYDALDYPLHPHTKGLIRMPYGAALHFQKHTTVPGTRDTESGAEQSYLGVIRTDQAGWPEQIAIDPPELCEPFTAEQCEAFGQRIEAVARDPREAVEVASVSSAVASGKVPTGRGGSGRKGVAFAKKGVTADGAEVDREDVLGNPDETAEERIQRLNNES